MALAALVLLGLNDHVLKAAYPSWLTGKLSDVAGMVFFPFLLQALFELSCELVGRYRGPSVRVSLTAATATGLVLAAIKLSTGAAIAYQTVWGSLQWAPRAAWAWLVGRDAPARLLVAHTVDPTDCLAIPFVIVVVFVTRRRATTSLESAA